MLPLLPPFADQVKIDIHLAESGWASLRVTAGGRDFEIGTFGGLTNPLSGLAQFGVDLALDDCRATVAFDGEPQVWRLIAEAKLGRFSETSDVVCRTAVNVVTAHDSWREIPGEAPTVLFEFSTDADILAAAILRSLVALEAQFGAAAVKKRMRCDFPSRGIAALQAAMGTARDLYQPDRRGAHTILIVGAKP